MSTPVTIGLPSGYRRVAWPGRMGDVAAVVGSPPQPLGSVLLLPGLTGSKEDYFAIMPGLADRGWAVAAVDLPGMYESAGSDDPADYTLPKLVADVARMLPQAGLPVHLVGHSAGGLIARQVAVRDPQRLASLTLYDSGSGSVGPNAAHSAELLRTMLADTAPLEVFRLKSRVDEASGRPAPPADIGQFLARRWEGTTAGHLIGMADITLRAPDLLPELAHLSGTGTLPVLALYGQHDDSTWTAAGFAALSQRAATATAVIPDAEHSPAVENPDAMVDALDLFWRSLP